MDTCVCVVKIKMMTEMTDLLLAYRVSLYRGVCVHSGLNSRLVV